MTDELTPELIELFKNAPTPNPMEVTYKNGIKTIYSKSILLDFYGADNVDYITDMATNKILYDSKNLPKPHKFRRLLKKIRTMVI